MRKHGLVQARCSQLTSLVILCENPDLHHLILCIVKRHSGLKEHQKRVLPPHTITHLMSDFYTYL